MQAIGYTLTQEVPDDRWEVEALYDLCFAPGRSALSSYRLRYDVAPVASLCFVARDSDGILSGAVRNWPVVVGGHSTLLLGPIAVHPTRQGEGLGALLMGCCIDQARDDRFERIMLVGDAPYYGRYGFQPLKGVAMPPPTNPDRILGLALLSGAWDGITGVVSRAVD